MSITLSALQRQRRDTAANWTAENPTLLAGEIGLESDTGYWKVGDGATAWTSLAYVSGLGAEIPVDRLADGAARQLLQTDAAGTGVEWTDNVDVPGTLDVTGAGTFDGNVTIAGDLTVNGTTTTINTQDLLVEDKNVVIGNVTTPSDVTADGGGITLKGTTDKTINWVDATDAWTLSEHVDLASGKEYRINGTKVLDATSLGSGVTSSSLTSVGTIGTGTWQGTTVATGYGGTGQTTYTDGELLIGKTDGTLAKATITQGSGVTITNGDGTITIAATGSGGTVTAVTGTSPLASTGGTTPDISIQDGTTAQKGAVQLEDSTSSTSTTTAATPNAVKSAYDLANAALPKAGGTMTGDIVFSGTQTFPGTGSGTVTSVDVSGGTGLTSSGGPITSSGTITVDLDNTAVTPGSYTYASITVDQQGRLTAASNGTTPLTSSDIGVTVQGYDADTAKLDTAQTFTAAQTFASDLTLNAQSDLRFADSDSSNWVAFQAPATVASNVTWTLPDADGTSGQVLSTDGAGALSWATAAGGATDKIEEGNTSAEVIDTGSDGRFVVTTEGSERARIDSSGRLLVGTSSARAVGYNGPGEALIQTETPNSLICGINLIQNRSSDGIGPYVRLAKTRGSTVGSNTVVQNGDELGGIQFCGADGADLTNTAASIVAFVDGTPGANDMPGRLVFSTTADGASSPTERMRITNKGSLKVTDNNTYAFSSDQLHEINASAGGTAGLGLFHRDNGSPFGYLYKSTAADPNNTSNYVFRALQNTDTNIYTIWSNGTVTARSDARYKKNIETTRDGYLEDLNQLRVVKYNWYNHEDDTPKELGFIAQEVEEVFPGLVMSEPEKDEEGNETGESCKSIKFSVFTPMLVKALQEAHARIEQLEARLTALESA